MKAFTLEGRNLHFRAPDAAARERKAPPPQPMKMIPKPRAEIALDRHHKHEYIYADHPPENPHKPLCTLCYGVHGVAVWYAQYTHIKINRKFLHMAREGVGGFGGGGDGVVRFVVRRHVCDVWLSSNIPGCRAHPLAGNFR